MSLSLVTVADSISKVSVSGVRICDLDEIPTAADLARTPTLFPEPVGFVQGLQVERDSYGTGTNAKKHTTYQLRYTFAYQPAGNERGLSAQYPTMVDLAADILDAFIADDDLTGVIDIVPAIIGGFGVVFGPDGTTYIGCTFEFTCFEFIN